MPHNPGTSRTDDDARAPAAGQGAAPAPLCRPAAAVPRRPAPPGATTVRLRVLATSDVHAHLLSHDYFANRPLHGRGLEQTAALISHARREEPHALLLDNGDFLQGTALGDMAGHGARKRPHPVITAFNTLRYDAVALGNHEFDYGTAFLENALKGARFPVVSANILLRAGVSPRHDVTFASPFALIRREFPDENGTPAEVIVGVIGLTPPSVIRWNRRHLEGRLSARPMVETVRAWVPVMQAAGADVIICLAHAGAGAEERGDEVGAEAIARIEGVDAVIAGHSHLVHPSARSTRPVRRRAGPMAPIVQPGFAGSHLGIVDLWLSRDGGRWTVNATRASAQSVSEHVAGLTPAQLRSSGAPLRRALEADHQAAIALMRRPVGCSQVPLQTLFATAAPSAALHLASSAFEHWVRERLRGRPEAGLPVIAIVRPLRSGGWGGPLNYTDIPAGALSLRNVFDLYPFPNTVVARIVTVAAMKARLERASRVFRQIRPGKADQALIDDGLPAATFEVAPTLSYRIDLSEAANSGRRIGAFSLGGRLLGADESVVLVTNSFLEASAPTIGGHTILDEGTLCTDAILSFLQGHGPWAPVSIRAQGWSFQPMKGTTVLYDSGANAMDHLDAVAHLSPEFVGISSAGFHRFRLHLDGNDEAPQGRGGSR